MTWISTKNRKKNADRLDEGLECQFCESFPNALRLALADLQRGELDEPLSPLVRMLACHHCNYRVCVPCCLTEAGQKHFDSHTAKCSRKASSPDRRFYLVQTTGQAVDGEVTIEVLDKNLQKSARWKENRKRSTRYLWYPYKSGTIKSGTAVCFEYHTETGVIVLNGLTKTQASIASVTAKVDVDGKEHDVEVRKLYLIQRQPRNVKRSMTIKLAPCKLRVKATWQQRRGVWEIKNFMLKHEGHISTAGKRAIGGKELTRLPEVVDRLAEFEAAKIPSKYLGYLMQYRFSQKYQFRAETLKLLASTQGPRP